MARPKVAPTPRHEATAYTRPPTRGAILAGGAASRYGGKAKGLETIGGERILDRVVRAVRTVVGNTPLLIANAEDATEWHSGVTVTKDVVPNCGAMSGLYTAVVHHLSPVLVVAWDMPFVPTALLDALVAKADDYDVFLPESNAPYGVEPLCGVYKPSCRRALENAMAAGDYRATGFHEQIKLGTLPLTEVSAFGPPETIFFNVNSPAELQRAEELWRTKPE